MNDVFEMAHQLLKADDQESVDRGIALYKRETEARPSDMKALFEYAGAFDFLGREEEALPHYMTVLNNGYSLLPSDDQPRLFVQLGSTLRNLRRFDESRKVLREGLQHFPEFQALKVFLALTEFSAGDEARSVKLMFEVVLGTTSDSSIRHYSRALGWYAEKIAERP